MFFGGTNLARWGGATPGVMGYVPSYGYAGALSENGLPNPSKYVNVALLARTLSRYAATIINNPYAWPLDLLNASSPSPLPHRTLYSYTIGSPPANGSVIFLFNRHTRLTGVVKLASRTFTIPYWTMLIIDGATLDVVYDSNTLTHPDYPIPLPNPPSVRALSSYPSGVAWQREPIGISTPQPIITALPIDQLMAANYTTSYVQYAINVSVTQAQVRDGGVLLKLSYANDFVYAWLDEQLVLVSELIDRPTSFLVNVSAVAPGMHQLTFVTDMMGTDNYTPDNNKHKGLAGGQVLWGSEDLTDGQHRWSQQLGLTGESRHAQDGRGEWTPPTSGAPAPSWAWYRLNVSTPAQSPVEPATYQLNMTAMSKGWMWVNGHELGLYWLSIIDDPSGCQRSCNRTSTLGLDSPTPLCRTGCGEYHQRGLYHVPADWLRPAGEANLVVLFEEAWTDSARQKEINPAAVSLGFWQTNED